MGLDPSPPPLIAAFLEVFWRRPINIHKSQLAPKFTLTDFTESATIPRPNRKTQIALYKLNWTKFSIWICTERYRGIWVSRFDESRGWSIFIGDCHTYNDQEKIRIRTWHLRRLSLALPTSTVRTLMNSHLLFYAVKLNYMCLFSTVELADFRKYHRQKNSALVRHTSDTHASALPWHPTGGP